MMTFLQNLLNLCLEAAPWLVLGLLVGGLFKAVIPTTLLNKHLSGDGVQAVFKAALLGAPLPLCSCGVIPAALGLRKAGASKPATVAFLVATPETGIDSVSISYAMLGPFMAIVRPVAAIVSAITAGLLVGKTVDKTPENSNQSTAAGHGEATPSCCGSQTAVPAAPVKEATTCCASNNMPQATAEPHFLQRVWSGIVFSFTDLFDKLLFWLSIGLVFAAAVKTFVPSSFLAEWGSGLPAMLVMLVVGVPMYVCATASTPIAAGLLLAGVSPGTAMVFLMAGPATNISTLGVIGKELGRRSLTAYLAGVVCVALLTGFLVDSLVATLGIDIQTHVSHNHQLLPAALMWAALLLLIGVVLKLKWTQWLAPRLQTQV